MLNRCAHRTAVQGSALRAQADLGARHRSGGLRGDHGQKPWETHGKMVVEWEMNGITLWWKINHDIMAGWKITTMED